MRILRFGGLCLLGAGLLGFCGCVEVAQENNQFTYSVGLKDIGLVALGGLAATIAGWICRKKWSYGWILFVIGLLVTAVFVPALAMDRATLTETDFHIQTGFYGTTNYHLRLNEIQAVQETIETKSTRRGRTKTVVKHQFSHKDGEIVTLTENNKLYKAAKGQLQKILQKNGVHLP